ncbi:helix-turn-helix domain-containing protein [Candidatus Chlorohelix sp.]|uniref:helix-turn-helix domain-containing protein n=1 Tax=Candidatus Chlorohelix sp. TaxID=3139201 RepID=UPI00303DA2E2
MLDAQWNNNTKLKVGNGIALREFKPQILSNDTLDQPARKRGRRSLAELRASKGSNLIQIFVETGKTEANSLGSRVKLVRRRLGLSQQELAGSEYVASYISAIERDKIHPSLKALQLIAKRLGEPVEFFLYGGYGSSSMPEREDNYNTSELSLATALRDKLLEAQALIERAGQFGDLEKSNELVQAAQLLDDLPRHQLSEYDRTQYLKLVGLLNLNHRNLEDARSAFEEAALLAQKTAQLAILSEIKNLIGNLHYLRKQVDQALLHHRDAWKIICDNVNLIEPELKLQVLCNLANDYLVLGRQEESFNTFKEALKFEEKVSLTSQRAQIYSNLADSYRERGDLIRARNYTAISLNSFRQINQRREMLRLSGDVGDLMATSGREEEAEAILSETISRSQHDTNLKGIDLALANMSLSWLRLRQGRIDDARQLASIAIEEAHNVGDLVTEGKALKIAADIEIRLGNEDEARHLFEKAILTLELLNLPFVLGDIYKAYGEALENWGDFASAVNYLKKAYESKR